MRRTSTAVGFTSYLKNACKRFVIGQKPTFITDDNPNKDINIAFFNLPIIKRLRELSNSEIGRLVSVTRVVTRTSEVRPELLQAGVTSIGGRGKDSGKLLEPTSVTHLFPVSKFLGLLATGIQVLVVS
ncbi:DNA replication licensing factor MCM6 [Tanacetum coccineum]